ncbi:hypothetical protein F5972_10925 [Microbispora cellulosiformans]|uniref:Uncharacterized protein n=1 Tax=Microbispora cellulosiformans TaxID=2614688 RepID=A0A5J5K8E7_9ACTN|nr:hypothetical protein [Microbispora cellulosiformans]KAA9380108.1 hypothetical protein F5972_10925 [Microbispora cellulosiformans]
MRQKKRSLELKARRARQFMLAALDCPHVRQKQTDLAATSDQALKNGLGLAFYLGRCAHQLHIAVHTFGGPTATLGTSRPPSEISGLVTGWGRLLATYQGPSIFGGDWPSRVAEGPLLAEERSDELEDSFGGLGCIHNGRELVMGELAGVLCIVDRTLLARDTRLSGLRAAHSYGQAREADSNIDALRYFNFYRDRYIIEHPEIAADIDEYDERELWPLVRPGDDDAFDYAAHPIADNQPWEAVPTTPLPLIRNLRDAGFYRIQSVELPKLVGYDPAQANLLSEHLRAQGWRLKRDNALLQIYLP